MQSDISTGQELLKSDTGNITEGKAGNWMRSITEEMKTEMNDLRREVSALESRTDDGEPKMEETFERQQKEVTSIVEKQTRHLYCRLQLRYTAHERSSLI